MHDFALPNPPIADGAIVAARAEGRPPRPSRPSPRRPSAPTWSKSRRVSPSHNLLGPPSTRIIATSRPSLETENARAFPLRHSMTIQVLFNNKERGGFGADSSREDKGVEARIDRGIVQ